MAGLKIEAVDVFYLAMPRDRGHRRRQPGCVRGARRGRRARRLGRVRGRAAAVDRGARRADVAFGAVNPVAASVLGEAIEGPECIRRIGDAGARAQSRSACRPSTRCRASIWRCGTAGARAGRAGVDAARLPQSVSRSCRTPRCCSATTRQAHSPRRKRSARKGSARRSSGGARTARASAKDDADHVMAAREGLGPDGPAAGRRRHCVGRRRGARRAIAAGADRRPRRRGSRSRSSPARLRPTRGCRENPARCGSRVARARTTSGWRGK